LVLISFHPWSGWKASILWASWRACCAAGDEGLREGGFGKNEKIMEKIILSVRSRLLRVFSFRKRCFFLLGALLEQLKQQGQADGRTIFGT